MSAATAKVPSPADAPTHTARQLLRKLRREGGRVYRMREIAVFCLTDNPALAEWMLSRGGANFLPRGAQQSLQVAPLGAFRMAKGGKPHWDIYVHAIPVMGEESIWEAAANLDDVDLYEIGDEEPEL